VTRAQTKDKERVIEMSPTNAVKLQKIQDVAKRLNQQLHTDYQDNKTYQDEINGGNLFAGPYYAESDRMYVSLNPGEVKNRVKEKKEEFDVNLDDHEWYWGNPEGSSEYRHHQNSNYFFHSAPALGSWMASSKFTSTFLMPWRTRSIASLQNDPKLERTVWDYSGQIIRLMFKDCRPKLLIVSGRDTLKYLHEPDCLDCAYKEAARLCYENGEPHRLHPCSRWSLHYGVDGDIDTFVVPHFSRAGSKRLLVQCTQWLEAELVVLGYI
jgi:hypothetical protein